MFHVGDRVFWFGELGELITEYPETKAWTFRRDSDLYDLYVFESEIQKVGD